MKVYLNSMLSLIFAVLILVGCDSNSSDPDSNMIIGGWEKTNSEGTVILNFSEDGSFTAQSLSESSVILGNYVIAGNEITLTDSECGSDVGRYNFSVGNTLSFTLISDDCNRSEILPGTWTRQ